MKKIVLFIFVLLAVPAICSADFKASDWQYQKNINDTDSGWTYFEIDDQMFKHTRNDLRSLRIIDSNKQEIPYKLLTSQAKQKVSTYYPRIINNSFVPNEGSSVILDFGVNKPSINTLTINTGTKNFQRNVVISGADKINEWHIIKNDAYIYDYSDARGGFKSQNTTLRFADSVWRYLKIKIADSEGEPVKINDVSAYEKVYEKQKERPRVQEFSRVNDPYKKTTELLVDMGSSGIPTGKMRLGIKDKNFNRAVTIFSSINNKNWRTIGQYYIFRYDTPKFKGENTVIEFNEINDQYIKVVINNQDNTPLDISGLTTYSIYRELVFKAEAGMSYAAYYGNKNAYWPKYDLDSYFQYLDLKNAKLAMLSTEIINPQYEAPKEAASVDPKSEKIPYLMTVSLIVSALLLLFLVFRFFRKK